MKGLIVDSSRSYQQLLGALFERAGLEPVKVASGRQALTLLEQQSFDLVCSSMFLEDMDGVIFSSRLRAHSQTSRIPLIMITSSENQKSLDQALAVGVTELFAKHEVERIGSYVTQFVMDHGRSQQLSGRVLYVEDCKATAGMTQAQLQARGLEVDHFSTAEEGFEAFLGNPYDLVLTDVILDQGMSGYALVQKVRTLEGSKGRVPILAISGVSDVARRIELLHAGANDFVSKPVVDEELLVRAANLITSKRLLDRSEAQQARLQEMAMRDQLTGLYNRHFLMETGPAKITEAQRHQFPCSLIVVDADKFKSVNDTHGHAAGDVVLQEIGGALHDACRKEDIAARFGGEEFVLLLCHCDGANALKKAEQLRAAIEALRPAGLKVTASFGVAELPLAGRCEFNDLFKTADAAVYKAKEQGRNRVVAADAVVPVLEDAVSQAVNH